jgi:hypothetical protein
VFAEEGPYAGEVGDVDGDGGFARVPEHVGRGVHVGEVVVFGKGGGENLEGCGVSRCNGH